MRICDECNFGTYGGRCIVCGGHGEFSILPPVSLATLDGSLTHHHTSTGISDAYYCAVSRSRFGVGVAKLTIETVWNVTGMRAIGEISRWLRQGESISSCCSPVVSSQTVDSRPRAPRSSTSARREQTLSTRGKQQVNSSRGSGSSLAVVPCQFLSRDS